MGSVRDSGTVTMKRDNGEEVTGLLQKYDCIEDEEFEKALCNSKSKKAAGADNINTELYKYLPIQAKQVSGHCQPVLEPNNQ